MQPCAPGRLDYLTEVLVLPPSVKKKPERELKEPLSLPNKINNLLKYFRFNNLSDGTNSNHNINGEEECLNVWCLNRISQLECLKESKLKQAFHVFASKESLPINLKMKNSKDEILLMWLHYIKPPKPINPLLEESLKIKPLYVRLLILEDFYEKTNGILSQKYDLYCSEEVFSYFGAKVGSKVTLECDRFKKGCVDEIEIQCRQSKGCIEKFKNYVHDGVKNFRHVIINTDVPMEIGFDTYMISIKDKVCGLVDSDTIRNCKLNTSEMYVKYVEKEESIIHKVFFKEFGNYDEIVQDCLNILKKGYKNENLDNILITGKV